MSVDVEWKDEWSRVACEVLAHEGLVVLCGYSQSSAVVDEEKVRLVSP